MSMPPPSTLQEPARTLKVAGRYEVIVAGGGIAGVAAAVAAARAGASVCLLEKAGALGGLATLGNVVVWLPICDGCGRQVMGGLPEELLKLSVADLRRDNPTARFQGIPACWRPGGDPAERRNVRYLAAFNPGAYLLALEKLAVESGIRILYDTRVCAVRREGGGISHVIVENKSGRLALAAGAAVDATGDADLCFLAGEPTVSLDSNVLSGWFYWLAGDGLHIDYLSRAFNENGTRENSEGPFFRGDDGDQVTDFLLAVREFTRKQLAQLRAGHPDEDIQIITPPTIPCFRMTRRLVGTFTLTTDHVHTWFDDAVGLTGDWRRPGPVYAIPWRALCGVRTRNLAAAGRCMSASGAAWDVIRAIPACALTGAIAGAGAALAVRRTGGDLQALAVGNLQERLRQQGFLLDPALVKPAAPE